MLKKNKSTFRFIFWYFCAFYVFSFFLSPQRLQVFFRCLMFLDRCGMDRYGMDRYGSHTVGLDSCKVLVGPVAGLWNPVVVTAMMAA